MERIYNLFNEKVQADEKKKVYSMIKWKMEMYSKSISEAAC